MLTILHGASRKGPCRIISKLSSCQSDWRGRTLLLRLPDSSTENVPLMNEWHEGYAFASFHTGFALLVSFTLVSIPYSTDTLLQDTLGYIHVGISASFTMLRLVSFCVDYNWACNHVGIAKVWNPTSLQVHGSM